MRRAITLIITMVLCVCAALAQAPDKFNYQTVVRNASNAVVADATVGVRVSILQGSENGKAVYVETHTATTNANGMLTLQIGGGNVQQGAIGEIDWSNGPYFLRTETDPNGSDNYSITNTQQVQSVPYAFFAKEAANSFSGDYDDLKNKPTIPQNIGDLTNDAGYITVSDLPNPSKGDESNANDSGVVQTGSCGEIDLCELVNRLARLQAILLPTVTTNAASDITETTATSGGSVSANGYREVTARGVCWSVNPNPTVNGSHTSDGNGLGTFTSSITGLEPGTNYYVRAYASNSVGTSYGEEVSFTTEEQPQDTCTTIAIPYSETFENYTTSTTAATGVEPDCWKLVQEDVTITDANRPQLYYRSSFAHSGNYSLKMYNRCVYAMPALPEEVAINQLRLEMYLRQANATYQLEVGVWDDLEGTFEPVQLFNNSTTNMEHVECDFTNYNGNGHRIAFHNVLGSGSFAYSNNYIDDIVLDFANPVGGDTLTPQDTAPAAIDGSANPCPNAATVTDFEGNVYNTVHIGSQCWMRENLRSTKFADGTPIPNGNDTTSISAPLYYDNSDSDIPLARRGYLYNWPAAMHGAASSTANPSGVQGICPSGWHLPSDAEFTQLTDYVSSVSDYQCGGNSSNIAKALAATYGWNTSTNSCAVGNTASANNATGFSAVPTGYFRNSFSYVGNYAFFWSSTENESNNRNAYTRLMSHQATVVGRNASGKDYGRPVRCLWDTVLPGGNIPTPQDTVPQYIQSYYKNAKNKKGYALRVAMRNIIKNHDTLSYNGLWNAFYTTDKRPDNNKVWDIYSDRPGSTPDYYFTFGSDQCGSYAVEGDCYNREHTVPKSWFGGSTAPMYTDLFQLYPTDGFVNSKRSNLPIGKVTNATWTSTNGSKVGTSNISGYSGNVFEPIDSFKGDFARIYFYMAVCYMDENLGVETQSNFSGGDLKPWAKQLLLQWAALDPVSQKEIDRNNAVYQLQNNRNPFVDYPELVEMIFGSDTNTLFNPVFHPVQARTTGGAPQSPQQQIRETQSSNNQRDINAVGTAGRREQDNDTMRR